MTVDGIPLATVLASDPVAMLGCEARAGRNCTALLVKLLDTGDDLSVQIHPSDDYPGLAHGETGKAECWYIIDREQGAGVYLGFRAGVTESRMREALESGADISGMLYFVPVDPGDVISVEPGTPHAIGKGITLLEPQYIVPGFRGVTYRYWDWNRRYDSAGRLSPKNGRPRPLHVGHALAVTSWERADQERSHLKCRHAAGLPRAGSNPLFELLCSSGDAKNDAASGVRTSRLKMARLTGTGLARLPEWDALLSLTVLQGGVTLQYGASEMQVLSGQTVALPACLAGIEARLHGAHLLICAVDEPEKRGRGEER